MPDPTPEPAPAPAPVPDPTPPPLPPAAVVPPEPDPELGDAGKKALDAERTARRQAEADAKAAKAELDALKTSHLPDQEKAIKEAADAARQTALHEVNSKLFSAVVKAESVGKIADPDLLADPEVAVRLLGFSEIPVTTTGDIDTEAISAAVASFVEARPYMAGAMPPATPPVPPLPQGGRGTPEANQQLTRNDLASMSPEQIDAARKDGRLNDLLAGKS